MSKFKLACITSLVISILFCNLSFARFLAVDPVGPVDQFTSQTDYSFLSNPQKLNRYTYGLNNPYRYIDRDGRSPDLLMAIDPSAYYQMRADEIGADMSTMAGVNQTANYVQNEAVNQMTAMITLYGTGGVFASSVKKSLVGNVDDFLASQMSRLSSKLGAKIGKGQLNFPSSHAGFDQAVNTVRQTLSNPSKTTGVISRSNVRGNHDLIHVYSSKSNHTVSLRVMGNNKYEFDTLIEGKSSKF